MARSEPLRGFVRATAGASQGRSRGRWVLPDAVSVTSSLQSVNPQNGCFGTFPKDTQYWGECAFGLGGQMCLAHTYHLVERVQHVLVLARIVDHCTHLV